MRGRSLFLATAAALLLAACNQPQSQAYVSPPPPPPQQQAQPSTYSVLFDTGRSNLSNQATSTIQQAAAAYTSRGGASVTVSGHTDTVGSQDYNMALSKRRADAVTVGLVSAGVPAGSITTSAYGETNLPQPTADQVPDQLNRSVQIAVGGQTTTTAMMSDADYCRLLARKVRTNAHGTDPTGDLGKALSDCQTNIGNYGIPFMENYLTVNHIPLPSRYAMEPNPNYTPAAQQSQSGGNVGSLSCNVAGGVGFVFGSSKDLNCLFTGTDGRQERYTGAIKKFGVDIGYTKEAHMMWEVFAPGSLAPGSLAGSYTGATASATVIAGAGANVLVGGNKNQVSLQPLSVEGSRGLNVAAGIGEIDLNYVK